MLNAHGFTRTHTAIWAHADGRTVSKNIHGAWKPYLANGIAAGVAQSAALDAYNHARPEFKVEAPSNKPSVKVLFANPAHNYTTNVASSVDEAAATDYFVGQLLDVGGDLGSEGNPTENHQRVIGIEYTAAFAEWRTAEPIAADDCPTCHNFIPDCQCRDEDDAEVTFEFIAADDSPNVWDRIEGMIRTAPTVMVDPDDMCLTIQVSELPALMALGSALTQLAPNGGYTYTEGSDPHNDDIIAVRWVPTIDEFLAIEANAADGIVTLFYNPSLSPCTGPQSVVNADYLTATIAYIVADRVKTTAEVIESIDSDEDEPDEAYEAYLQEAFSGRQTGTFTATEPQPERNTEGQSESRATDAPMLFTGVVPILDDSTPRGTLEAFRCDGRDSRANLQLLRDLDMASKTMTLDDLATYVSDESRTDGILCLSVLNLWDVTHRHVTHVTGRRALAAAQECGDERCPECTGRIGSIFQTVSGRSGVTWTDGEATWTGETDIDWDSQRGTTTVRCEDCGHDWHTNGWSPSGDPAEQFTYIEGVERIRQLEAALEAILDEVPCHYSGPGSLATIGRVVTAALVRPRWERRSDD